MMARRVAARHIVVVQLDGLRVGEFIQQDSS